METDMAIQCVNAPLAHAGVIGFPPVSRSFIGAGRGHVLDLVRRAVPETASKWRVIPVAAALMLLAMGAAVTRLGRIFLLASSAQKPAARTDARCADDVFIRIPISQG
jgi:hypothetical protein